MKTGARTVLVMSIAVSACKHARSTSTLRVIGGIEDTEARYPDTVLFVSPLTGRSVCSGTVIGKRAVLTAAHCVGDSGQLRIRVGERDIDASRVLVAKAYDENDLGRADVALAVFGEDLGIAPRAINFAAQAAGEALVIVGYGCGSLGIRDQVPTRRYGSNVLRTFDPSGTLAYTREDPENPAPGEDASACAGDSGGPLLIADKLVGVTSGTDGRLNFATWVGSKDTQALLRVGNVHLAGIDGVPPTNAPEEDADFVRTPKTR